MKLIINKKNFIIGIICIASSLTFFLPYYYRVQSSTITRLMLYVSLFIQAWFILVNTKRISKSFYFIIALCITRLLSTLASGTSVVTCFKQLILIALPALSLELIFRKKIEDVLFKTYFIEIGFFFVIFFIYLFKYPNGIPSISTRQAFYLFGNVNSTIGYVLPALFSIAMLGKNKKSKIIFGILTITLSILFIVIYPSTTATITLLFFGFWYLFLDNKKETRNILIMILIFFLLFELYIVLPEISFNLSFVSNMLNKGSNFSGRSTLWNNAISLIKQKPLLGKGYMSSASFYSYIGNQFGSHNYFLDILVQFGIFGLISTLLVVFKPIFKAIKYYKEIKIDHKTYVLLGFCFSYLIMFLAEPIFSNESFFISLFYILSIRIDKLISQRGK